MKRFVLDSSAILAVYLGEAGAADVADLLQDASADKAELWMSVVNWGEVYYSVWVRHGEPSARRAVRLIEQMPIDVVNATHEQARRAAEVKAQRKLGYADCYAVALALEKSATLVTADRDFLRVKDLLPLSVL